jgi:hypothetical protein
MSDDIEMLDAPPLPSLKRGLEVGKDSSLGPPTKKPRVIELNDDSSSASSSASWSSSSSSSSSSSAPSSSSSSSQDKKKKKNPPPLTRRISTKILNAKVPKHPQAASIEDALTNILTVKPSSDAFKLYPHQEILLNYSVKRMQLVKFESTPTSKYHVVEAPNSGIQGASIVAEKGMGKSRIILQLGLQMKRISGPWLVFESLTLFKELDECLHNHFAPEYHGKVLFFHPDKIGLRAYKEMTLRKLKEYQVIIMTMESYMSMVFDFGFEEDSAIYGDLDDGTRRILGYGQCTYEQTVDRAKYTGKHEYKGPSALMAVHFDGVVIDESHVIRNGNTRRSIALTTIARLFNFVLSGDPLVNSSNDFFNQLKFLGYKGAPNIKEWENNLAYFKKRDNLVEDRASVTDRTDPMAPIKVMTLKKDAPYLILPQLHKEQVMLEFKHQLEVEVNKVMSNIMTNLINAATNNRISKKFVLSFFTFQNLAKIAPYLIAVASKRENYKFHIFSETADNAADNKTIIGDEAFNSYFSEDVLTKITSELEGSPTLLTAPIEDGPDNGGSEEAKAIELGTQLLEKVVPKFLMSDLIANIDGPAGTESTTMQWIIDMVRAILDPTQTLCPPSPSGKPRKIIIGTNFVVALDLISKTLRKHLPTVGFVQVDGSIRGKKRDELILQFQNDPKCHILVINSKIGSYGHNLTQANFVIDVDGWYNDVPGDQLICRAWRPGQKEEVWAFQLFRKNTIDMHILNLRTNKRANIDEFWKLGGDAEAAAPGEVDHTTAPKKTAAAALPPKSTNLDFATLRKINNIQKAELKKERPAPEAFPPIRQPQPPPVPLPSPGEGPSQSTLGPYVSPKDPTYGIVYKKWLWHFGNKNAADPEPTPPQPPSSDQPPLQ